jgi:putative hydroxymethylpyrimidine transport system substrate-binding protein
MRKLAVLLVVVLVAGCGSTKHAADTRVSVMLDWTPNPDHVGLYQAKADGQFAKQGLNVTIHAPSDPTTPLKLVAAGKVDLAVSYEQEVFFAAAKKLPVEAVAAVVPVPLNSFMSIEPSVESLADLHGKTVGITGVPSDDATLKTAGLWGNVKVVNVGYNLVPALLSHRVDAVLGVYRNVEGIQLAQRGLHPTVIPVDRAGVPSYDELVLVASKTRLADKGYADMVSRFLKAFAAGTSDARAHPQAAVATLKKVTASPAKFLAAATPATLSLLTTTCLQVPKWQDFGYWMFTRGLLKQRIAASTLATSRYCRA